MEWDITLAPVCGGICRGASLSHPRDVARQRRKLDRANKLVRSRLNSRDILSEQSSFSPLKESGL